MKVKSWRRFFRMIVFRVLMVMVMLLTVGSIGQADEYQSLYPLIMSDISGCLKSPCDGYIRYITSVVGNEVLSGAAPASGEKTFKLKLVRGYQSIPGAFRLFIPPGTTSVSVTMSANGGSLELNYRFKDGDPTSVITTYITLQNNDIGFSPGESGWFYVTNNLNIYKLDVTIKVDLAEFVAWYNGSDVRWDENGDPWSADNGVAPVEVCAPDNLEACNESNCPTDGEGYWYNDYVGGNEYCHAVAPNCSGDDCQTESQCLSADGDLYWYEDEVGGDKSCHPVPACKRDIDTGNFVEDCTPVNCVTAVQCEDADFFWYEDETGGEKTCHELRACESVDPNTDEVVCLPENCVTEDQCTSSNFYWYEDVIGADKYCHSMPACGRELGSGAEVDCSPDNCITADQCVDAHFYWYQNDGEDAAGCHQEPQQGVCSQDNLLGCKTESDCIAAGGEWRNYTYCGLPYTPPASYTYTSSASSSPTSSTSSGSTAVSGSNWFSFLFATNSAPAPAPVCDAEHLDACDQTGCAGLGDGYWWYDGACRAEPVQADFHGHLSSAPVSPGAGADDGVIAAGEGLSFTIAVPADCRLYAVLSIPDVGAFFISNDEILTANMVPVASGTIPVIDDICRLLTGELEYLKGTWTVYTLAVPAAVGESPAQLGAYLEQGGLYALGSYTIEVGCQEVQPQVQPQVQSSYTVYDIPRPSQN